MGSNSVEDLLNCLKEQNKQSIIDALGIVLQPEELKAVVEHLNLDVDIIETRHEPLNAAMVNDECTYKRGRR